MAAASAAPAAANQLANIQPANLLADIGEERLAEGRKNLSSELAFLLAERGVSSEVQAWIGLGGPMSIENFSTIDLDEKAVREWLDTELGLRTSDGRVTPASFGGGCSIGLIED